MTVVAEELDREHNESGGKDGVEMTVGAEELDREHNESDDNHEVEMTVEVEELKCEHNEAGVKDVDMTGQATVPECEPIEFDDKDVDMTGHAEKPECVLNESDDKIRDEKIVEHVGPAQEKLLEQMRNLRINHGRVQRAWLDYDGAYQHLVGVVMGMKKGTKESAEK